MGSCRACPMEKDRLVFVVVRVSFLSPLHNDCELKSRHRKQDNTVEADRNQEREQAMLAGEVMVLGET